ncbi:MAG: M14 family zinc carboxypeptidase [Actinomycetota bacterium]
MRRRALIAAAAAASGASVVLGAGRRASTATLEQIGLARSETLRSPTRLDPPAPSRRWVFGEAGRSVEGRPIEKWTSRAPGTERRRVLVVAAIHGNEPITRPLADAIGATPLPDHVSITILPTANPDGWARNQRRNATGVDLNRNFPWRWSPSDGGPGAASAPETQAMMRTVVDGRFDLALWIHQPLAYVAPLPGCPTHLADAWLSEVGDRRRTGLDQHGGGETWCARVAGVPTMLVEVATWTANPVLVEQHRRGFSACVAALG